jgi:hypothetical protein
MDNTPIRNGVSKNAIGNYAAIPGTGPALSTCLECAHLERDASRGGNKPTCGKFRKMTGRKGSEISTYTEACRYFEDKAPLISGLIK